ncbi:MAG TPA: nitrous oxide reductase accessory protein NosL [Polyangia bacterium]|nr:nitrous oxide reductase accessory protein NosL [Polyangia bacterium]
MKWLFILLLAGCSLSRTTPAALDTSGKEACAFCRMAIVDGSTAAQLVAPGEEPRFFDDLGCLRSYLATATLPWKAAVYVADHRTKTWVPLSQAVYARQPALETPMGSQLIAHANEASRASDGAARGATPLSAADVFKAN